ncbi:hypothetical protein ACLOJK_035506 [Asimina triloba]
MPSPLKLTIHHMVQRQGQNAEICSTRQRFSEFISVCERDLALRANDSTNSFRKSTLADEFRGRKLEILENSRNAETSSRGGGGCGGSCVERNEGGIELVGGSLTCLLDQRRGSSEFEGLFASEDEDQEQDDDDAEEQPGIGDAPLRRPSENPLSPSHSLFSLRRLLRLLLLLPPQQHTLNSA